MPRDQFMPDFTDDDAPGGTDDLDLDTEDDLGEAFADEGAAEGQGVRLDGVPVEAAERAAADRTPKRQCAPAGLEFLFSPAGVPQKNFPKIFTQKRPFRGSG